MPILSTGGNPQPADRYDLVVIWAGTAGLVVAARAAGLGLGLKVALVERSLMGGDCLICGLCAIQEHHPLFAGSSRYSGCRRLWGASCWLPASGFCRRHETNAAGEGRHQPP